MNNTPLSPDLARQRSPVAITRPPRGGNQRQSLHPTPRVSRIAEGAKGATPPTPRVVTCYDQSLRSISLPDPTPGSRRQGRDWVSRPLTSRVAVPMPRKYRSQVREYHTSGALPSNERRWAWSGPIGAVSDAWRRGQASPIDVGLEGQGPRAAGLRVLRMVQVSPPQSECYRGARRLAHTISGCIVKCRGENPHHSPTPARTLVLFCSACTKRRAALPGPSSDAFRVSVF